MTDKNKYKDKPHTKILFEIYQKALTIYNDRTEYLISSQFNESEKSSLQIIADNLEKGRGVLAVLITSLIHKLYNPIQDIRFHQENMKSGYSGRGVDTKFITPFMKEMKFPAMSESGWLTRSLEQNRPYDSKYPGKITPPKLKAAFLHLIDQVQNQKKSAESYLLVLFLKLIEYRELQNIDLAKPTNPPITTIISYLERHFEASYLSRGASRLPTLAVYAVYQCMIKELKRFENKMLMPLEEHTSSDKSSGSVGDIEVRDTDGKVYEAVEIKYGIPISTQLIRDAYEKFKSKPIQRYYLLSTNSGNSSEIEGIAKEISKILTIHGCQVITNGIYPSLKYYLRLLSNNYEFIDNYVENLKKDSTVKYEHKLKWNEIVSLQVTS